MRNELAVLEDILMEQRITNALLRATSRAELDSLLDGLAKDGVDAAIMRALLDGEKPARVFTQAVMEETSVGERTVQQHVAALMDQGIVQREGGGPQVSYHLSALFSLPQLARLRAKKRDKITE